jgi:GDP-L-fucose synthase
VILVTGATGFLGKRVCRKLSTQGLRHFKTSLSLGVDLRDEKQCRKLFEEVGPDFILNCAAYVGGIQFGYKHPAELFHNNLLMTLNLLKLSKELGVKRIVNPISNCAYPSKATLFKESEFWDGPLHESVMVYGLVRKASWVGSWAYAKQYGLDVINLVLSNMYGPEDHFAEERSHALGALVMKFSKAKIQNLPKVVVWGTGKPVREWLHVDDGAEAMIRALEIDPYIDPINIGLACGMSIKELAIRIRDIVGYQGEIVFDDSKPDGAAYKTVDGSFGEQILKWKPQIHLDEGLKSTIDWYLNNER